MPTIIPDVGRPFFVSREGFDEIWGKSWSTKCETIGLGTVSDRLPHGQNNSRIFGSALQVNISWRGQNLVLLEGDLCSS